MKFYICIVSCNPPNTVMIQNSYITPKIPSCSPFINPVYPPTPTGNYLSVLHQCSFAFWRMSRKWNDEFCNLLRLASCSQYNTFENYLSFYINHILLLCVCWNTIVWLYCNLLLIHWLKEILVSSFGNYE